MSPCNLAQTLFFLLISLLNVDGNPLAVRNLSNTTERIADLAQDTSVASLEEALSILNNLTSSQKVMWDQQRVREEELRKKNEVDEQREQNRTKIMEDEHNLFNEMRGKISRKLRSMTRNPPSAYAPSEQISSPNVLRPKDCADIYLSAEETSGIYRVWPTWDTDSNGFLVYCDMDTDEGGWTVIRRWGRNMFSRNFYKKPWKDYEDGFGDMNGDFWLGNYRVYVLTNQDSYEIRFDIQTPTANESTTYKRFWIDSSTEKYRAHVEELSVDGAGDLFGDYDNTVFSTSDKNYIEVRTTTTTPSPYYGNRREQSPSRTPPQCSFAWWYKESCAISDKLVPWTSRVPMQREMKIRPVGFIKMKQAS